MTIPEIGDYVKLSEFEHPETTNFAVVSEYCWMEPGFSSYNGMVHIVADERGALLTVIRLEGLDTYQHNGWQNIAHRINDGKFRQYLNDKKERENEAQIPTTCD